MIAVCLRLCRVSSQPHIRMRHSTEAVFGSEFTLRTDAGSTL